MSFRAHTLAGLLALALVFAGALLLLDRLSEDPAGSPALPEAAPQPSPEPSPPPAPPHAEATPAAPLDIAFQAPVASAPSQVAAQPRAPSGPRKADLLTSLNRARLRVFECAGLPPPSPSARGRPGSNPASGKPGLLLLDLEPLQGEVMVTAVTVQDRGDATEALLDCARGELEGRPLEAAASAPGKPMKMRFSLDPAGR